MPAPQKAHHVVYADFDVAWREVLQPWFAEFADEAWESEKPLVVSCPHSSLVALLKQRLAENDMHGLGIHFTTLGSLRRLLLPMLGHVPHLALREDLHLLARMTAESRSEKPVAQSIMADPSAFVRTLDTLEAGHWGPDVLSEPILRESAQQLSELLKKAGLMTVHQADWQLFDASQKAKPRLTNWLAVGFSSADWPNAALLQAAFNVSQSTTLCFLAEGERPTSAAWTGTWEALAGPMNDYLAELDEQKRPYARLAEAFASHSEDNQTIVDFTVTSKESHEAENILKAVKAAYANHPSGRIGIVVPSRPTGLAHQIAHLLASSGIPHQDRIGHRPVKSSAHRLFTKWIYYQTEQTASSLLAFARTLRNDNQMPHGRYTALEKELEVCFLTMQTNELSPLLAYTQEEKNSGSPLKHWLDTWPLLPKVASFLSYGKGSEESLQQLQWPQDRAALHDKLAALGGQMQDQHLSRTAFMQWLSEVADIPGRTRADIAREAFAPVQILDLQEATGQPWSSLFLVGMVYGDWPAEPVESPFLSASQVLELNGKALQGGGQGIGHHRVNKGKSLLPIASDERAAAENALQLLLSAVTGQAHTSVSLHSPASPNQQQPVSEWFLRLIEADRGLLAGPDALVCWASRTSKNHTQSIDSENFSEHTQVYYERRDTTRPYNRYGYSLEAPIKGPKALSASAWSHVFARPVTVWYQNILGIQARFDPAHSEYSSLVRGVWLHEWMQQALGTNTWTLLPKLKQWQARINEDANETRLAVHNAYQEAGRTLPDRWLADWQASLSMALDFAETVCANMNGKFAAGELKIEEGSYALCPALPDFPLIGRVDLLLADCTPGEDRLPSELTLVDYKTGADKPLKAKNLLKGEGLQLALYALALRSLYSVEVDAILLSKNVPCTPQINTSEMETLEELWETLATISETGCLGDKAEPNAGFGFETKRPLAELPIPGAIKSAKWALTHPKLTGGFER